MMIIQPKSLCNLSSIRYNKLIEHSSGLNLEKIIQDTIVPVYKKHQKSALKTLKFYTKQWDGFIPENFILDKQNLKIAYDKLQKDQPKVLQAFKQAYKNLYTFHKKNKPQNFRMCLQHNILGVKLTPFNSIALYVPGGKALYPSTVLMGVIPASIAKVRDIIVISPPQKDTQKVPLVVCAMAYLAGADRILQAGGAQAIISAALGIPEINMPPVDFIYGPGNVYVSAAKSFIAANNICGIDSFAGPSEIVIIADHTAQPNLLAHDLLAQAEHDENAVAILLCTDTEIAQQTAVALDLIISNKDSKRANITKKAIQNNGHILIVDNIGEAIQFSNQFAPEHLEIHVEKPRRVLKDIQSAGSVFLGPFSPVAVGDYYSGTNHILPTNRAARFSSGINVSTFLKRITYQECSAKGLKKSKKPISIMSETEGLFDEHGYSVLARFES